MRTENINKLLLALLVAVLWLPLALRYFQVDSVPLHGVTEEVKKPAFSREGWLSGDFQKRKEWFYGYHLGLRNTAVRLANELDYRLGVQRKYCIVGKSNELMGREYIGSYYGKDFIGADSIQKVVSTLVQFQKMLNDSGIHFFIVIPPSKARLHPQNIPDEFSEEPVAKNNYTQMRAAFDSSHIPLVDFQEWFEQAKDTMQFPVFSNLGLHWSNYAATLAADSLLGFISSISGKRTNRINFSGVTPNTIPENNERDMLDLMNLLSPIPLTRPLGKWKTELRADTSLFFPRVLVVGDSYYWNIIYSGIEKEFFASGSAFFYYNKTAYFNNGITLPTDSVDIRSACFTKDVVFFLYAEPNLKNIGNGMCEEVINE